jgi:hypothetical protein
LSSFPTAVSRASTTSSTATLATSPRSLIPTPSLDIDHDRFHTKKKVLLTYHKWKLFIHPWQSWRFFFAFCVHLFCRSNFFIVRLFSRSGFICFSSSLFFCDLSRVLLRLRVTYWLFCVHVCLLFMVVAVVSSNSYDSSQVHRSVIRNRLVKTCKCSFVNKEFSNDSYNSQVISIFTGCSNIFWIVC